MVLVVPGGASVTIFSDDLWPLEVDLEDALAELDTVQRSSSFYGIFNGQIVDKRRGIGSQDPNTFDRSKLGKDGLQFGFAKLTINAAHPEMSTGLIEIQSQRRSIQLSAFKSVDSSLRLAKSSILNKAAVALRDQLQSDNLLNVETESEPIARIRPGLTPCRLNRSISLSLDALQLPTQTVVVSSATV